MLTQLIFQVLFYQDVFGTLNNPHGSRTAVFFCLSLLFMLKWFRNMERLSINSEIFTRSVEEVIKKDELQKLLENGRKLRIKYGVDVTATDLHLGHAVNLWKMRELQEYGHKVVFLIGDFTTKIGDPTGRLETRRRISAPDINKWAKGFIKQVSRILRTDRKVFEVRRNSEWYGKMSAEGLLGLTFFFTHARLIERDMFQRRMAENKEIAMPELIYPILQGYDSVMLKSDLTIIGSDQLFNEGVGRVLQEKFGQPPQVLITTSITPGIDGKEKMSKSLGNYIGLEDSAEDKFGKIMSIPDKLIVSYLTVYTDVSLEEIGAKEKKLKDGSNPMEVKLFLAEALTRRYHGEKVAQKEKEKFLKIFSRKKNPEKMPAVKLDYGLSDPIEVLLKTGLVSSKSEARRLIGQGAVDVDGRALANPSEKIEVKKGVVIKIGKRKFIRVQ